MGIVQTMATRAKQNPGKSSAGLYGVYWFLAFLAYNPVNDYPVWAFLIGMPLVLLVVALFAGTYAKELNDSLRKADLWLNRSYGNVFGLDGYSPFIVVWTFLALHIVFLGPTYSMLNDASWPMWFLVLAVCVGIVVCMIVGFARVEVVWGKPCLHGLTTLILVASCAGVFLFCRSVKEADRWPYGHIFLLFIACAAGFAYLAPCVAGLLISGYKKGKGAAWANPDLLHKAELFVKPLAPAYSFWGIVRSAIETTWRHMHLFLFPVAVIVLMAPHGYMNFAAVATALFALSVLAIAGIYERLYIVLDWLQRSFFQGVLAVVSVFVIVLAGCRFFDFSYISIIMNSASNGTLVWFLIAIYATLWFYKYWVGYMIFLVELLSGLFR